MSDRPTPLTDEIQRKWVAWDLRCIEASSRGSHLDSDDPAPPKPWEVARTLERQLAEAKEALETIVKVASRHDWIGPAGEMDAALAACRRLIEAKEVEP